MASPIALNIGPLLSNDQGARLDFDFSEPLDLEKDDGCHLIEKVSGHVRCMKLPHEISVHVSNLHTRATSMCVRCTKQVEIDIDITSVEREFLIDLPKSDLEEGEDSFYVHKSRSEIVIDELLRQEILLHFPPVTLCLPGCKGLCDKCGANRNEKECSCTHDATGSFRPFYIPQGS